MRIIHSENIEWTDATRPLGTWDIMDGDRLAFTAEAYEGFSGCGIRLTGASGGDMGRVVLKPGTPRADIIAKSEREAHYLLEQWHKTEWTEEDERGLRRDVSQQIAEDRGDA